MQLALMNAFDYEAICQVAEVLILTVGVALGWLIWPVVHQKLAHSASQRKEAALLEESEIYDVDLEAEKHDQFEDEHLKVAALFDHYGLFGAPLGAWNSTESDGANLDDDCLEESAEESAEELEDEDQDSLQDEHLKVAKLFEHYSLFGASPGAWSSTGSDGADLEDDSLDESAEELTRAGNSVEPAPSQVAHLELFEHYGLFGAPVGTWSS